MHNTLISAGRHASVLLLAALCGCGEPQIDATRSADERDYAVDVLLSPARFETHSTRFEAVGTARAIRSVALFPDSSGEVTERAFHAGQRVSAGQVLLRLDDREERLAVELAQVQLRDAERLYARYTRAEDQAALLPTTVDAAATASEAARIALERARLALSRRALLAPFDGVVGISDVEVGDRVGPSTQVATLDQRDALLVRLEVPEALMGQLQVGDPLTVAAWDGNGGTRPATVVDIGSRIDPATRTFTLQAKIDNSDDALRPGMSFRVALDIRGASYPVVPEVAVQWGAKGAYVWREENGRAVQVAVNIVQRRRGEILVEGALGAGDLIVVEGVQRFRDGVTLRDVRSAAGRR